MNYSLPGSTIHGIFQARILEWVAISFSSERVEQGAKFYAVAPKESLMSWDFRATRKKL